MSLNTHRQLDLTTFVDDDEDEEIKFICKVESADSATLNIPATHEKLYELIGNEHIKGRHTWTKFGFKFVPSMHNIHYIESNFHVEFENMELRRKDTVELPSEFTSTYTSNTKPFKHQIDALNFALKRKQFALFMEQGTGKTKVMLDYAGTLFEEDIVDSIIVIAPKGVHRQWIEGETPKHLGCSYQAFYWQGKVQFVHKLEHALSIFSFNYDALRTKAAQQQIELILNEFEFPILIMDESHKVKSSSSQRWKSLKQHLADKIEIKASLTGTPIAKNLVDEWAQLYLVNKDIIGLEKKQHFIDEYSPTVSRSRDGVIGPMVRSRNIERFKELTREHVFRLKKTELGLAEKTYSTWYFDMSIRQAEMYYKTLQSLLLSLRELQNDPSEVASNDIIRMNHYFVRMQKLQQISNGWINDSSGKPVDLLSVSANPRINALIECVESKNGEQVIIWCRYNHDVSTISKALDMHSISHVWIDQRVKPNDIELNLKSFMESEVQVMITTPAKLGTGYNLQVGGCLNSIYYSNSENSIDRWQSEDRIHRIGTKGICNYTDIIGHNTRDLQILKNLQGKKNLADYVLDDVINELSELMQGASQ